MPADREKQPTAREAFDASLSLLQRTSGGFFKEGGCVACHAQPMAAMVMQSARANKIALREDTGAAELKSARLQWSSFEQRLMQKLGAPGDPDSSNYALALFDTLGAAPDRTTDAMIVNLLSQQLADGRWRGFGFAREPMEGSDISRTALAIRAVRRYAIPARMPEIEDSVRRATAWLQEAEVLTTEDRAMQVLGLLWSGKSKQDVQKRAKALIGFQRQDGGWSQTANLESDAYATGQSLYALVQAGVKTSDPAFRRGAAYLLKTQHPDGSWHVLSRSPKFQPYFQSGFPHDHDQWISMSATAWAASALAYASSDEKPLRASR